MYVTKEERNATTEKEIDLVTTVMSEHVAGMYGVTNKDGIATIKEGITAYVKGYLDTQRKGGNLAVALTFLRGIDETLERFKDKDYEKVTSINDRVNEVNDATGYSIRALLVDAAFNPPSASKL